MKRGFLIAVVLSCVFCWAAGSAEAGLLAGAAHVKITPEGPIPLAGYGERWGGLAMKKSTGVHDDLYARALVLQSGETKLAFVTCDLCVINSGLRQAALRELAKAETGIPADNVMVTGTHTHSGAGGYILSMIAPPVAGFYNPTILKTLSSGIAAAIVQANSKLAPATFGAVSKEIEGYNRNRRGSKTLDKAMTVLRFDGADGKPVAIVVNFAAHATIIDGTDMQVSRGWPGGMVDAVREHFGDQTEVIFCNGAQGDASPCADGGPKCNYERSVLFGKKIAKPAIELAERVKATEEPALKVAFTRFDLPPGVLGRLTPSKSHAHRIEIGKTWLMGMPGEAIMRIGLDIKEEARKLGAATPVVVGLADDHLMYFVTREEFPKGGYEVMMNMYGPAIEDTLVRAVLGDRLGKAGPDEAKLLAGSEVIRGKGAIRVRLAGDPYRMGYQHGKLLRDAIRRMYTRLMDDIVGKMEPELKKLLGDNAAIMGIVKIVPGGAKTLIEPFLCMVARKLNAHTPRELREEIAGVADGCGLAYDQVFWMNSLLTMVVQEDYAKVFGDFSLCTNVVQLPKEAGGRVIHARNLDWMYRNEFAPMTTVFEFRPDRGNAFLSVTFPGVVGVLTAINDKQLSLGNETVNQHSDRSMDGMPIMTICRMAIQYDSTLDDMVRRIKDTPGTAGMHVMMGDGKHRRALAVDRSAKYAAVREPKDGVLFGVVLEWPGKPYVGGDFAGPGICATDDGSKPRYTWLTQKIKDGSVPLATAEDWCKVMVRPDEGLCADSTIHTTVMVPETGEL
ncbi:MAG: neutral/alkaline non-lysosomal ceramidase N-terminal domain-containing protein, partial [Phycisphaerae bacterium]|nr:neutral/alkaline non-lysosomal ceramidase N-terminal domain-containing protein [Phycisphaerae bacterium]